jgi:hypothetical protein
MATSHQLLDLGYPTEVEEDDVERVKDLLKASTFSWILIFQNTVSEL